MRLFSVLLASASLFGAELTFTSVTATSVTDGSAIITWATTGSVNGSKAVKFDTNAYFIANGTMRYTTIANNTQSFSSVSHPLTGLAAGTEYVACPLVTSGSDTSICTSSGASSSRVTFTTSAATTLEPTAVNVSDLDTTYPTSFGATLTVANDCSDLTTKVAAALSVTYSGQNVKVVTPADSVRTGTCPLLTLTAKSGGTNWVVIESGSANLPTQGQRVTIDHGTAGILTTMQNTAMSSTGIVAMALNSRVRFRGIWWKSASTASAGDGDPSIAQYLFRFDGGVSDVIFDQCLFGQGYPHRLQNVLYGFGSRLAVLNSTVVAQVWKPWVSDYTLLRPTAKIIGVTGTTYYGVGNKVCSVGTWQAELTGSVTTTGVMYIDTSDCSLHLKYASAITTVCSNITCELDAGLSVPSTGRTLSWDGAARTFAITSSEFKTAGAVNTPYLYDNSPFSDLANWNGTPFESEWNSFFLNYDRGGGANENHSTIILQNNDCICTGIDVFITPVNVTLTNVLISRNLFHSEGFVPSYSASSPPWSATRRFHIELKSGAVIEISGNVFAGGYVNEVNTGAYAISLKNDAANGAVARVGDILIKNNWVVNEPAFVYSASMVSETGNYLSHISRLKIDNNLVLTDAIDRTQAWADPAGGTIIHGGIFLWRNFPTEKLTVSNNTWYRGRGAWTSALLFSDGWQSGLSVTGNLFVVNNGTRRGVMSSTFSFSDSTPVSNISVGSDGTAALAGIAPNGYTFTENTLVSGCNNVYTCTDATASGDLVGDLSAQYPASTWFNSGDLATRLDALNFYARERGYPSAYSRSSGSGGATISTILSSVADVPTTPVKLRGGVSVFGGAITSY